MREHMWETEPISAAASPTRQQAKVSLMSQSEYVQYAGRFGAKDNSRTWMFRTARALTTDGKSILRYFDDTAGYYTSSWPSNSALYLRPMFYLDKDFFSTVKLNSAYMGSKIKKLVGTASADALAALGYTAEEIGEITAADENAGIDVSIVFPETGVYPMNTECSISAASGGSYRLTVSGDGAGSVTFSGKDDGIVVKKCSIQMSGSGNNTLIFTLERDGRIVESMRREVFCADVYSPRPLDSISVRGVYMDLSAEMNAADDTVLNSLGVKNVMLDFLWEQIEPEKGQYDFSAYREAVERLTAGGIRVWISVSGDCGIYGENEKEAALSAVVQAMLKEFPTVGGICLSQKAETSAELIGGGGGKQFYGLFRRAGSLPVVPSLLCQCGQRQSYD